MRIIGVDLAYRKPIVYAVLSNRGKFLFTNAVETQSDIYALMNLVVDRILVNGPSLVVAETPLMINNRNTAFMMAKAQAMLEMGIRRGGGIFYGVHPVTWQKDMLHPPPGADRKALSITAASDWLESCGALYAPLVDNDIADAINIARWGLKNKKEILGKVKRSS